MKVNMVYRITEQEYSYKIICNNSTLATVATLNMALQRIKKLVHSQGILQTTVDVKLKDGTIQQMKL